MANKTPLRCMEGKRMKNNNENQNKKRVYIRPEDITSIILKNLSEWNTREKIRENIRKIHSYLKNERLDKLQSEFGLNQ